MKSLFQKFYKFNFQKICKLKITWLGYILIKKEIKVRHVNLHVTKKFDIVTLSREISAAVNGKTAAQLIK